MRRAGNDRPVRRSAGRGRNALPQITRTNIVRVMAHLTASVEYGLHCLLGLIDAGEVPRSARDLATFQGVSPTFAAKIFAKLEKAGIVVAAEGVRGGYRLARAPEAISMGTPPNGPLAASVRSTRSCSKQKKPCATRWRVRRWPISARGSTARLLRPSGRRAGIGSSSGSRLGGRQGRGGAHDDQPGHRGEGKPACLHR